MNITIFRLINPDFNLGRMHQLYNDGFFFTLAKGVYSVYPIHVCMPVVPRTESVSGPYVV